jgi:hypothetical protein
MTPPGGRRAWVWYFVLLAVLTVTSITVLIRFNLGQQLTLAKLAEARARWETNGPKSYDIALQKRGTIEEIQRVEVRDGKVVWAIVNGRPLEPRLYAYSDMPALFDFIEDFLKLDSEPGKRRTFCTAAFDPGDGHVVHFVRRVMGTTERIEITVKLRADTVPSSTSSQTVTPTTARHADTGRG